jgi:hypothetical protein
MRYYPGIRLAGLRKTTTHFSISDSGPDLKPRLSKYEIGVLRHSVTSFYSSTQYCIFLHSLIAT